MPLMGDQPESADMGYCAAATAWMFPWERRQMGGEGTPLRTWERLYWGVFVMAIATYLFSRLQAAPAEAKVGAADSADRPLAKMSQPALANWASPAATGNYPVT